MCQPLGEVEALLQQGCRRRIEETAEQAQNIHPWVKLRYYERISRAVRDVALFVSLIIGKPSNKLESDDDFSDSRGVTFKI